MKRKQDHQVKGSFEIDELETGSSGEMVWVAEFPGQHKGESIELVFRQHPIVMRKALLLALCVAAVGELPLLVAPPSFLGIAVKILALGWLVAVIVMAYRYIGYHYSVYILTDSRLIDIHQKGFFYRQVNEVGLNKIQSINYSTKGLQAAVFKFGDITVQTYAGTWNLRAIHHPVDVHAKMIEIARGLEDHFDPSTLAAE
jgi:uncharacterized membrane protein YdbT with pleckstrin-like domain